MGHSLRVVSAIRWTLKPKQEVGGIDHRDVLVIIESAVKSTCVEIAQYKVVPEGERGVMGYGVCVCLKLNTSCCYIVLLVRTCMVHCIYTTRAKCQ